MTGYEYKYTIAQVRLVRGGMGWVHHSWLSCNPPICWMRQNMANGHPGLRSLEDMSLPVWDTESSARTRWHIMFVMVTHCPDLGAQRTQTWLLSVKAVKDLLFPWSGSLVTRRGPLTFRLQYIHKNMTFKKIGKIYCALREAKLFSEFINIYVAALARVFRKYFAELVPVFI